MTDFRRKRRGNNANQFVRIKRVLPNIPGCDLILNVHAGIKRYSHGKQQSGAVIVNLDVPDCGHSHRHVFSNVNRQRPNSRTIAIVEVSAKLEGDLLAQVLLLKNAVVVGR